ncbi:magnesium/cobalt transporter CorA [uncultured Metabacillus sp.]|uniref:magnesium/cobalt transporter CorA n=1 Tax=uncultured Metabacillus sp. TaxID=2860135 RepID=UPI002617E0A3|nr:magnesium/cobalt transporter CorA [uncultured Metabacillus sp.]
MINCIAVSHNLELIINCPLDELDQEHIKWFWIDFNKPTDEEIGELDRSLHFHPLAIEDCIHKLQRPKLDYYEDYCFFVTHSLNPYEVEKEEINFFLGENYIVSFHHQESKPVYDVWERLKAAKKVSKWDQILVLYHIIDKLVDNYFPIVYQLEEALDQIENNTAEKSMEQLLEQLFDTRHYLLKLRHTVIPMRDLLYRMLNSHRLKGIKLKQEYFADIYDHLLKLTEMIEANRELTNDIRDSYLSLNSHQTNRIMRVLTVITTIFMPLTFIAGVYGMNFENMPELRWDIGYFVILFIMLGIGIGMFFWFKKKGWFN